MTNKNNYFLVLIFVLAFILRIFFVFQAYHGDLNNNISWGNIALERGLTDFYEGTNWDYSVPNQPPLTIILFYSLTFIYTFFNKIFWFLNLYIGIFPSAIIWFWERWGIILLMKLPSIIADLLIGGFIYKFIKGKSNSNDIEKPLVILLVWLFNPVVWYNSSVWGQTDSVVNLLGIIAVIGLINRDIIKFSLFFTLSLLFKGSLVIFLPLVFAIVFFQRFKLQMIFKGITLSLIAILVISFFFHPQVDFPIWFLNLYKNRIFPGEIGFLTANAFNFWWLIDSGGVLDSRLLMGLSFRIWSVFLTLFLTITVIFISFKKYSKRNAIFAFALSGITSFLFLTRVHERYLYPFFPYATILLFYQPKIIIIYAVLSLAHIINLYNLFWWPPIPLLENILKQDFLPNMISIINIINFIILFLIFLGNKSSKNKNNTDII